VCLEKIRRDLKNKFANSNLAFDIVKVATHQETNAYPEIGVYSTSGNITD